MKKLDFGFLNLKDVFDQIDYMNHLLGSPYTSDKPIMDSTSMIYCFTGESKFCDVFNYKWEDDAKNCKKLTINIPGYSKDDVSVNIEKDYLVVEVHGKIQKFNFDTNNYDVECAECKNGQLTICFKLKEKSFKIIEVK